MPHPQNNHQHFDRSFLTRAPGKNYCLFCGKSIVVSGLFRWSYLKGVQSNFVGYVHDFDCLAEGEAEDGGDRV